MIARYLGAPPRLVQNLHASYFRKLEESDSKLKKLSTDLDEEVADFLANEDCLKTFAPYSLTERCNFTN